MTIPEINKKESGVRKYENKGIIILMFMGCRAERYTILLFTHKLYQKAKGVKQVLFSTIIINVCLILQLKR